MIRVLCACFWLLVAGISAGLADPITPAQVPEDLKPWIDWVLRGNESRGCPFLYNSAADRLCAWPSRLELNLSDQSGIFRMQWAVQAETWVHLPGDGALWPQDVQVDGKPGRVMARDGLPAVLLSAGSHAVGGRLLWERLPEQLTVPRDSGIITLSINGREIPAPTFNEQGQIWLEGAAGGRQGSPEVSNRMELQVFRQIIDDIPLRVITHLDLDVSGAQREVLLEGALPADFTGLSLDSQLPARLEPDGRLRVQLRPGRWQIELTARRTDSLDQLPLPALPDPWPAQEIWVFQAKPHLRVVELEGLSAVDPNQTNLPDAWRSLPAYRIGKGETLRFRLIQRGDPQPEPDSLVLTRDLWLDFDGGGYTVSDLIAGKMTHDWRLNVLGGMQLGRVAADGVPQLITRVGERGPVGVEVRRGSVKISADSRIEGKIWRFPVTAWDKDFRTVKTRLHLPPGWRLFAATGVDNAPDSWVNRWTLLDLFLVLIAGLAVARLWNWPYAVLALVSLALLWHEAGAPKLVWLNLLAAIALLRVLPAGRAARLVRAYRALTLLALVFISLPFMVEQIRNGIYPQLELAGFSPVSPESAMPVVGAGMTVEETPLAETEMALPAQRQAVPAPPSMAGRKAAGSQAPEPRYAFKRPDEVDSGAVTQTGPGLPQWRWRAVTLGWNGPVLQEQELGLWLISPRVNMLFNFGRVLLLIALGFLLVTGSFPPGGSLRRRPQSQAIADSDSALGSTVMLLVVLAGGAVPVVRAEFPDPAMLDELKARLLAPHDCLPECAQISLLRLKPNGATLQQELEIHAQQSVAVPLPALEGQWLPSRVTVDGAAAEGLRRSGDGALWLHLQPGRHQVVLLGPLPQRERVQIPLPLKPRRVERVGNGWLVGGIGPNGVPDAQLQLTRIQTAAGAGPAELEPHPLPAFLEVQRTLQFGLDWHVTTRIRRLSPLDAPIAAEIPLLDGESVITPGLSVRDGKASVNLVSGQSELSWDSVLEKRSEVALKAPETTLWVEDWRVDVSPIWHLQSKGIAVAHHQDSNGNWLPEWRPWPGETVTLSLTRPEGVPGNSLTIESSHLQLSPARRATDASLTLNLRSSQGGQHVIKLPVMAALQSVAIDGQSRPIRQQDRSVTVPIHPGQETVTLTWRENAGVEAGFSVPEIDLGASSVNSFITVNLPGDRWVLLTDGPRLGPAVLFWGVLGVIVVLSVGLGRLGLTPLKAWQWALLLVGLSQVPLAGGACVVAWLFLLGWRASAGARLDDSRFNVLQLGLALLSLVALTFLFYAVEQGLLGLPDMQVAGNNSDADTLNWYQDHSGNLLPRPWMATAPLWGYRLLMLAWALWLAYSLLNWLRWGWQCYSEGGLWRPRPNKEKRPPESGEGKP